LTQEAFDYFVNDLFASDRRGVAKGIIEVLQLFRLSRIWKNAPFGLA
jgi:hypothetical protein